MAAIKSEKSNKTANYLFFFFFTWNRTQEAVDLKLPASSDELKELLKTNNKVVVLFASYGVLICIAVEAFIYQFVQMYTNVLFLKFNVVITNMSL